jgi:Uma2 family endonuclease
MSTAVATPASFTPQVGQRLLTAEDLAVLPRTLPSGDVKYELDDGRLVVMAPPGDLHARRQAKIIRYLDSEGEEKGHGEVRGEVAIILRRNPDRVVGADAAFILNKSLPVRKSAEGYLVTIPELVVEVRSKNDTQPEIAAKSTEYFAAGVEVIWIINPDARTVTVSRHGQPDETLQGTDTLTCQLIPGFAIPVANLFRGS